MKRVTLLAKLPLDIWILILSHITDVSINTLTLCCKTWQKAIRSATFWKLKYLKCIRQKFEMRVVNMFEQYFNVWIYKTYHERTKVYSTFDLARFFLRNKPPIVLIKIVDIKRNLRVYYYCNSSTGAFLTYHVCIVNENKSLLICVDYIGTPIVRTGDFYMKRREFSVSINITQLKELLVDHYLMENPDDTLFDITEIQSVWCKSDGSGKDIIGNPLEITVARGDEQKKRKVVK